MSFIKAIYAILVCRLQRTKLIVGKKKSGYKICDLKINLQFFIIQQTEKITLYRSALIKV